MGHDYYYFTASLPMIQWGGKPLVTAEEFLESAQRLLSKDDGALIGKLLADQEGIEPGNAVADAWVKFDQSFRNEMAVFRAQQAHKDPSKVVHGAKENEPALREVVQETARMDNLLEAEKLLDKTRWQYLDELSAGHYYDLEFLICYGLKLRILARHQAYASSVGSDVFETIRTAELPIEWVAQGI